MKWAYSIKNRLTIAALLMVVFISVFVKNILDEGYVSDLSSSTETIYEDRLLPESYIYHLSAYLYKKQMIIDDCDSRLDYLHAANKNLWYNSKIDSILVVFEGTYLTDDEAVFLEDLKANVAELYRVENSLMEEATSPSEFAKAKSESDLLIDSASVNLDKLSDIQLTVGKKLNDDSQRIVAGSSILSRFETALLVVLAIVINILIFGVLSSRSKMKQRANWN